VQQQAAEPDVGDRARPRAWLAGEWARMMSVDRYHVQPQRLSPAEREVWSVTDFAVRLYLFANSCADTPSNCCSHQRCWNNANVSLMRILRGAASPDAPVAAAAIAPASASLVSHAPLEPVMRRRYSRR
jgi:hypothetical protein